MTKKFKLLDDDDEELVNWECTRLPQSSFRTKRNSAIPSDRADATQRRDVHTVGEKRGRGRAFTGGACSSCLQKCTWILHNSGQSAILICTNFRPFVKQTNELLLAEAVRKRRFAFRCKNHHKLMSILEIELKISVTTPIKCPNVVLNFHSNRLTRFRVMNSKSGYYFFLAHPVV